MRQSTWLGSRTLAVAVVACCRVALACAPALALAQGRPIPGPPTGTPPAQPPSDPPTIGVPRSLPPVIGVSPGRNTNRQPGCRQGDEVTVASDCVTVSSGMLEAHLTSFDADREFYEMVLVPARSKTVVIVFDGHDHQALSSKLRVARALYDAEVGAFDRVVRRVREAIARDTAYATRIREEFRLDDAKVADLRHTIVAERQSRIDGATSVITGNPSVRGLQFECSAACRDLNDAAKYLTIFP